jgi:hypothetical protein
MIYIHFRFFNHNADDYIFKLEYYKLVRLRNLSEHLQETVHTKAEEYVRKRLCNS